MDMIAEAYARGKAARRNATATSILDTGATLGLFVGTVFWNNVFWRLIGPAGIVEALLSLALAAGYALILPMLLSLLAPSTPAGMLLAETKYKTWGHAIAVAAAGFMCYHAFTVVWAWWQSRPGVVETGQDLFMAIGTLIIFVVVPALSWVQMAPDRWVAEVVQAQQVKRLKAAQQANIMAAQIQYARTMAQLKRGVANLTAQERAEVAGTLVAMQRAENEAIGQVAEQLRILTGIDTGVRLLDDPQIEQHYYQLTDSMEKLIAPINEVDYVELPPMQAAAAAPPRQQQFVRASAEMSHQEAIPVPPPPPAAAAAESSAAATRREPRRYAAEFRAVAAAAAPPAVFTSKRVAEIVEKSERTARDMITAWLDEGWIARGDATNSYYITREG